MPEPDCFLRYRISAGTRNFMSGKSDVLTAAATRGFTVVLFTEPVSRRNTFVGGTCAPRSALLVVSSSSMEADKSRLISAFYPIYFNYTCFITINGRKLCDALCISAVYAVVREQGGCLVGCLPVTFVYCVKTAKDTAIVAIECE